MNRHVRGFVALLVLGTAVIMAVYYLKPVILDQRQKKASDAGERAGSITVGMDNWIGYYPLCSKEMKKRLRGAGYLLKCQDDSADYGARMKKLRDGKLDFAVATIDSYILNAADLDFPGVIVMVIDESKGGDAIVARDGIDSLDDLKKREGFRVAFTPDSPSEHLLKAVAVHFDIPELLVRKGEWRMETQGSPAALAALSTGTAQVAVLWEPDVTKALALEGVEKLIGTEDTDKLIVDILLANRDYADDHPEIVQLFLAHYFRTLRSYSDDPESLKADVARDTDLPPEQVESMLKGVSWVNLHTNARRWFGISSPGTPALENLVDAVESTVQILVDNKDFRDHPIPDEDPYRLMNSRFVGALFLEGLAEPFAAGGPLSPATVATDSLEKGFPALTAAGWEKLREVGTLKVRPITFQSGTSQLSLEGKTELDKAVRNLKHYPNYRVIVKGHTGRRGDPEANRKLSRERADAVARYLTVTYGIDVNRLQVVGLGANSPLPQQSGETDRAYSYRLPRVELYLVGEVY